MTYRFPLGVLLFCGLGLAHGLDITVRTGDPGTTSTGGWYHAGAATQSFEGHHGLYASVSASPVTYTFSAAAPISSWYQVQVYNNCFSPRSHQMRHELAGSNGSSTVVVDQDCQTDPLVGTWRTLGEVYADQGGALSLTLDSTGSDNQYVGASVARFVSSDRVDRALTLGQSSWMPFPGLYDGASNCAGTVTGLPPGIAFDTVCNLYGTPTEVGQYVASLPLADGSTWQVAFVVGDGSVPVSPPTTPELPETLQPDAERDAVVGISLWLPWSSYGAPSEVCAGPVQGLPAGLAYDTVCNIYGTPTELGVFDAVVSMGGANFIVRINVTQESLAGSGDPAPVEPPPADDPVTEPPAAPPADPPPQAPPPDLAATNLAHPVLFALVVPPMTNNNFGHQLETFGNHRTGMLQQAPRGGDLALMATDRSVRLLTREAGFGVESGQIQSENAIAVRQPSVHWDGTRALFSMVIGGPTQAFDQSYRQNRWQIYELTNLDQVIGGAAPVIVKVANQPSYNNISPIYGSDGHILFTSDAPLFEMGHTYPQFDEYESTPTNTGIFRLNPATGAVRHLSHSPSGDFDLLLASDGRVLSTRWEHLKRDQQASNHRAGNTQWQPVNYENESSAASVVIAPPSVDGIPFADPDGTPYETFPEAFVHIENGIVVEPNRDLNEPLHDFNEFLPWEITENGERHQTMNHVGRHEFGGVFQNGSKLDDPNLVFDLGTLTANNLRSTVGSDAGLFQLEEDPRPGHQGTFYGTWAEEFGRFSSGRIFEFSLPIGANPQDMTITDWTNAEIDNVANSHGHFRNPMRSMNGDMLASWTPDSGLFSAQQRFTFRLVKLVAANTTTDEHLPSEPLAGAVRTHEIVYWGDGTTPFSQVVELSEVDPVEVVVRPAPTTLPAFPVAAVEAALIAEEGVDVAALRQWMIDRDYALIVIRNATERDAGERQQPFNLRVPGGVESTPANGKIYDISHLQLFGAEMIRGYGLRNFVGRRPIATALRNTPRTPEVEGHNLFDPQSPVASAVQIATDGSAAAFVPATRALSWQTVAPDGEPIVRERQWVTFAPGEIRTCEGCHGINNLSHGGNPAPTNPPEALRTLLTAWKGWVSSEAN